MSTQTNRGLIKPDRDENYSIEIFNDNCDKIEEILDSSTSITIPADTGSNYTTLTDKDGVDYYYIDIPVTGMIADYNGLKPVEPVLPDPSDPTNFSLADNESIVNDYFSLIIDGGVRSYNGYVRVFVTEKPDTDFDVYLYGV